MKNSIAVQAFKSITSRIHPQLPLSPKESQRLLNALNSSFNQHLDREFPSTTPTLPVHPTLTSSHLQSSSSSATTDIHLASILTNPLFGRPAQGPTVSNAALAQIKTKAKHPVQIFEDAVAKGQATIEIARLCLNAFRASLDALSTSKKASHIKEMQAGTRVLRWLWSSGKIHAYSFTDDIRFLDSMSHLLVAEANEAALWSLMETSSRQITAKEQPPATELRRRKGLILCSLIKAHLAVDRASPHEAVTSALAAFLRAFDVNQASASSLSCISLPAAGALLSRKLVNFDLADSPNPTPTSLYDRFLESCLIWDKTRSDRALYRVAALKLHHPTSPSARDALYFIRHLKQSPNHPFLAPSTDSQRTDVFKFFFDTVHLLQAQAFEHDAAWVMEFMQLTFPHHLGEHGAELKTVKAPSTERAQAPTSASAQVDEPSLSAWRIPDLG